VKGGAVFGAVSLADFGRDAEAEGGFGEGFGEEVIGNPVGGDVVVVHDINAERGGEEFFEADGGDEVIGEEGDAEDPGDGRAVEDTEEVLVAFPAGEAGVADEEALGAEALVAAEAVLGTDGEGVRKRAEETFDENADAVALVRFVGCDDGVRLGEAGVRQGGGIVRWRAAFRKARSFPNSLRHVPN
jgi:hypothetical protein